jgi:hypothetical protein
MSNEELGEYVASESVGILKRLDVLKPYFEELWKRFDELPKDETINGCATRTEFCNKILHRTRRSVQYILHGRTAPPKINKHLIGIEVGDRVLCNTSSGTHPADVIGVDDEEIVIQTGKTDKSIKHIPLTVDTDTIRSSTKTQDHGASLPPEKGGTPTTSLRPAVSGIPFPSEHADPWQGNKSVSRSQAGPSGWECKHCGEIRNIGAIWKHLRQVHGITKDGTIDKALIKPETFPKPLLTPPKVNKHLVKVNAAYELELQQERRRKGFKKQFPEYTDKSNQEVDAAIAEKHPNPTILRKHLSGVTTPTTPLQVLTPADIVPKILEFIEGLTKHMSVADKDIVFNSLRSHLEEKLVVTV